MTEQRIPSQWQLQNTGEPPEQWMLHEEEQNLPEHMQLHQDPQQAGRGYDQQGGYQQGYQQGYQGESAWQPIDYRAMQQAAQRPSNRSGLVLGGLLIAVLLGVGGYLAWFYGGQPGFDDIFSLTTTAPPEATVDPALATTPAGDEAATPLPVVPAVAALESPTPAPTLPPTATPNLVEIRRATVNSEFGVNARSAASADAELLELLANGASFLVAAGPATGTDGGQWYEVVLTDNRRAYVSADFVTPASEFVAYDDAVRILGAANLPTPAPPVAPTTAVTTTDTGLTAPAVVTATTPSTATGALAGSSALTVETTTRAPGTSSVVTVSAVISAPAGLNLRNTPAAGENVIQIVSDTLPIDVIGRSVDTEWVQIELADGTRGWVAASFVNPASTLDVIPLGTTQPLTPTVPLLPVGVGADALTVASAVTTTAPATTTSATTGTAAVTTTAATTLTAGSASSIGVGAASASLPTPTPGASTGVTTTATTTGTAAAATPAAATAPEVVVTSLPGVNLRPQPSEDAAGSETLEWNTSHSGIGRTADSAWIQIETADGAIGWVSNGAVLVQGGPGVLPVVE